MFSAFLSMCHSALQKAAGSARQAEVVEELRAAPRLRTWLVVETLRGFRNEAVGAMRVSLPYIPTYSPHGLSRSGLPGARGACRSGLLLIWPAASARSSSPPLPPGSMQASQQGSSGPCENRVKAMSFIASVPPLMEEFVAAMVL